MPLDACRLRSGTVPSLMAAASGAADARCRWRQVTDRNVENLSGGELQRFAIAVVAAQDADIYMVDEPSSYLDVRQRLKAAQVIRDLLGPDKYVIVVEHDLSVLDYLSDFICCLYGQPGAPAAQPVAVCMHALARTSACARHDPFFLLTRCVCRRYSRLLPVHGPALCPAWPLVWLRLSIASSHCAGAG